jgi:hypothetical protein
MDGVLVLALRLVDAGEFSQAGLERTILKLNLKAITKIIQRFHIRITTR